MSRRPLFNTQLATISTTNFLYERYGLILAQIELPTRKPVAHSVHNFGRADQLDRDELVRLCKCIARVCDLEVIDRLAQGEGECANDALPEDIKLIHTVGLGPVVVIEVLWNRLGMGEFCARSCARKGALAYERALLAMTANRLCEPESKLGVWDRWLSKVYLPACERLLQRQMYEAMDFLYAEAHAVEEAVFFSHRRSIESGCGSGVLRHHDGLVFGR
jgi:hypothetical protein